jgi:hypothetical protein
VFLKRLKFTFALELVVILSSSSPG